MIENTAKLLEARVGIEPTNEGFADLGIGAATTNGCNSRRLISSVLPAICPPKPKKAPLSKDRMGPADSPAAGQEVQE